MGLFRRADAGTNHEVATIPVFGVDPHGEAMFAGILAGTLGTIAGARPVIDTHRGRWHGWTQPPQHFKGAVGVVGGGRPVVSPVTVLHNERGHAVAPDVIQEIFESRATAGRFE